MIGICDISEFFKLPSKFWYPSSFSGIGSAIIETQGPPVEVCSSIKHIKRQGLIPLCSHCETNYAKGKNSNPSGQRGQADHVGECSNLGFKVFYGMVFCTAKAPGNQV